MPQRPVAAAPLLGRALRAAFTASLALAPPALAQNVAGRLLVDLDASDASAGTETWKNAGSLTDFVRHGVAAEADAGWSARGGLRRDRRLRRSAGRREAHR